MILEFPTNPVILWRENWGIVSAKNWGIEQEKYPLKVLVCVWHHKKYCVFMYEYTQLANTNKPENQKKEGLEFCIIQLSSAFSQLIQLYPQCSSRLSTAAI